MRRHLTVLAVAASATACGSYAHHSGRPFEASPVRVPHREPAEVSRDAPLPSIVPQAASPVVVVTTKTRPPPGAGWRDLGTFEATCYVEHGTTASGDAAGPGSIAIDPRVIPMHAQLYVEGYGAGEAADTGGAVLGRHVDLWMAPAECAAWGKRSVDVREAA